MKTSKASSQASTQEECGVWLDTVDLKRKAKQKRPSIPISKLLNPLARSGGSSLAVALNFTQTKIQMPVTKQSSISSFFTLQPKVTAKMPASPEPSRNTANVTPSTSNRYTLTSPKRANGSGIKRKRAMVWAEEKGNGAPPTIIQTSPGGKENATGSPGKWDNQTFKERVYWERAFMPQLNMQHLSDEEMEKNGKKRKHSGKSSSPVETGACGKDGIQKEPGSACSIPQCNPGLTESWGFLNHAIASDTVFPESIQSPEGFRPLLDLPEHTFTQRGPVQNPLTSQEVGKESDYFVSIGLPSSNKAPLSPVTTGRQIQPCTPSPRKHVLEHPLREPEGDTLAMLFTQDSEGFQVIAHRAVFPRSPLKDRTNVLASSKECRSAADQTPRETEEEEEILFTQDSQGNMVIKHPV